MSVDLSNPSALANDVGQVANLSPGAAREALAEIRASQAELQAFVAGVFDRLDSLVVGRVASLSQGADGLPAAETGRQPMEPEVMQSRIDQLAAVAAELTALAAEQRRVLAKRDRR
jgi:hypothetical protein